MENVKFPLWCGNKVHICFLNYTGVLLHSLSNAEEDNSCSNVCDCFVEAGEIFLYVILIHV
jgi:hypothetical protein